MIKKIVVVGFLVISLSNIIAQERMDSVLTFKNYKQFIFYTRDSVARFILAQSFDDFTDFSNNNDTGKLRWDTKIDYHEEEFLVMLTNYCIDDARDYLFEQIDNELIVATERLLYSDENYIDLKVIPDIDKLDINNKESFNYKLSIYNDWNKSFDDINILPALDSKQLSAYRAWIKKNYKEKMRRLKNTLVPKKVKFPCSFWN